MTKVNSFQSFINESQVFMKLGDRGEQVKRLQTSLEALGFKLKRYGVDGIFGPETFGATQKTLATIAKLTNLTQIVGDPNILKFDSNGISQMQFNVATYVGNKPEMVQAITSKMAQESAKTNNTNMAATTAMMQKNIPDYATFLPKLNEICKKLQINPNWLLVVMYKESKFKSKAQNSKTLATGLIQFLPTTAEGLGTSTQALLQMSATQQLDYVYKFLSRWSGKMKSVLDVYMSVFYPVAVGKPDSFVIGSEKSQQRAQEIAKRNPAISKGKPVIAKSDFKQYVIRDLPADLAAAV